ncbi:MAG: hypothetical protein IPJ71_12615 [Bdellovibrionales bacterium]|nr:hypothetical protein [Bdellovibrionales bacterium]
MTQKFFLLISIIFHLVCSTTSHASPLAEMTIMAHRGIYQTYPRENIKPDTCTAEIIYPPMHDFLENTVPSMAKAYELNADTIELDIQATTDGKIVVFHDWTLECRTNGTGVTQEQTFDYLRNLDIGYGYTSDKHATHPFRCEKNSEDYSACMKKNQMPTLREVFQEFPNNKFVINMKSKSQFTLDTLVNELKILASDLKFNLRNLSFYCNDTSINEKMRKLLPEIDVPKLGMAEMKACLGAYFKTGSFPSTCGDAYLGLPVEDFRNLGDGKAKQLIDDVHAIRGKFVVLRVDSVSDAQYLEKFDVGLFWTDRIDIVGPLVKFYRVTADLKAYDSKVESLKTEFSKIPPEPQNKSWVKQKLAHMVGVDQFMRKYLSITYEHKYTPKEERHFWKEFGPRWKDVDTTNTNDLKELIKTYDWFRITDFDKTADQNAWLLVQHADHDPVFQKETLSKLEKLYKSGDTNPQNYAYLVDRVAASWNDITKRQLQLYGTQGTCVAPGKWEPIPMEEPANVDARRKEVGLGPHKDYVDSFKDICK